jgi:hypothetical protein
LVGNGEYIEVGDFELAESLEVLQFGRCSASAKHILAHVSAVTRAVSFDDDIAASDIHVSEIT